MTRLGYRIAGWYLNILAYSFPVAILTAFLLAPFYLLGLKDGLIATLIGGFFAGSIVAALIVRLRGALQFRDE